MLINDSFQSISATNKATKSSDNVPDQKEQGCCNKDKFEESMEKAVKAFSVETKE